MIIMKTLLTLLIGLAWGAVLLFLWYQQRYALTATRYVSSTTSSIITQLQETSKLTSMTMTVAQVIESRREFEALIPWFDIEAQIRRALFDDALIMTIEGVVNAGVDLSQIGSWDVVISTSGDERIATIFLPETEIFDVYLTENTKPFERSLGILSKGDATLETQMRNAAIQAIKEQAIDQGILAQATESAKNTIAWLIRSIDPTLQIVWRSNVWAD